MAEKIRDAEYQLSELTNQLKVNQDEAVFGLFGEGLAEDIEDYIEHLEVIDSVTEFTAKRNRGFWESLGMFITSVGDGISEAFGNSYDEAKKETDNFARDAAKTLRGIFGEGTLDSTKLTEAIARIKKEVVSKNPQIQGAGLNMLEASIDDIFSSEFGESYDRQAAVSQKFLDQLKKDYSSTFSNITDDILDKTNKWQPEQISAFHKTYDKLKNDIPQSWSEILDEMLKDLNSRDWTIKVMAKMGTMIRRFRR